MKTLSIVAFFLFYIWYTYTEIKLAKKKKMQQSCKNNIVVARLKKEENGRWLCKFFLCGDHLGYFEKEPTSERVKAIVVEYNKEIKLYRLEELEEE